MWNMREIQIHIKMSEVGLKNSLIKIEVASDNWFMKGLHFLGEFLPDISGYFGVVFSVKFLGLDNLN